MGQVKLSSWQGKVQISTDTEAERVIYSIFDDNFVVSISVDPTKIKYADIQKPLTELGLAVAEETELTQLEATLKKHLAHITFIELAVFFHTSEGWHNFLSGRFYRRKEDTDETHEEIVLNVPVIEGDESTAQYSSPDLSQNFTWSLDTEQKGKLRLAANTASELASDMRSLKSADFHSIAPWKPKSTLTNDHTPLKTSPFAVKTFAAGSAISAVAIVAMVMTFTAKYAASHAVVNLVSMKAMTVFWPIALGVGSALVLGSLYQYAKQRSLFSCCSSSADNDPEKKSAASFAK